MKRKISLVIAFALSFLLMFSPIARADETKFNTVTTSEPIEIEVAKIPQDTNKANSPLQKEVKVPVLDKEVTTSSRGGCVPCPDGSGIGHWMSEFNGTPGYCIRNCN